jgi:hypothetical protein
MSAVGFEARQVGGVTLRTPPIWRKPPELAWFQASTARTE